MRRHILTAIVFLGLIATPAQAEQLEPAKELPEGITAEQVTYLIESLAEGLADADMELMEMSLQGLRAAGQEKEQLLKSIEDAMYAAVVRKAWPRVSTDVWTLAARAWAGEARARLRLKAWAKAKLIEREALEDTDITSMPSAVKARRKSDALVALAWLKDDQAAALARRVLDEDLALVFFKKPEEWRFNSAWGRWAQPQAEQAVRALIETGAERGEIMERIQDTEKGPAHRVLILWGLADVLNDDGFEKAAPLVELYQALVETWLKTLNAEVAYTERFVMLGPLRYLPPYKQGLAALEKVRGVMDKNIGRFMDGEIRGYRRRLEDAGVKAPPPPAMKPPAPKREDNF